MRARTTGRLAPALVLALAASSCRDKPEPAPDPEPARPEKQEQPPAAEPHATTTGILEVAESQDPEGLEIAPLDEGGFLVLWSDWREGKLLARRFRPDGTPADGPRELAGTGACRYEPAEPQACRTWAPAFSVAGDGSVVAAWTEENDRVDLSEACIKCLGMSTRVRAFSPRLEPIAGPARVDTPMIGIYQEATELAAKDVCRTQEGGFVVAWTRAVDDGPGIIHVRQYEASAEPASGAREMSLPEPRAREQCPALEPLGDGYAMTWKSGKRIMGQMLDGDLAARDDAFEIARSRWCPAMEIAGDGSLVVAWREDDVHLSVYGKDGTAGERAVRIASEQETHEGTTLGTGPAAIAPMEQGGFVLVWQTSTSDSRYHVGLSGRRFAPDGRPEGGIFAVRQGVLKWKLVHEIDAAFLADGTLVVAWWQGKKLFLRLLDPATA